MFICQSLWSSNEDDVSLVNKPRYVMGLHAFSDNIISAKIPDDDEEIIWREWIYWPKWRHWHWNGFKFRGQTSLIQCFLNGLIKALFWFLLCKPKNKIPKTKPDPLCFPCVVILFYYIMCSMSLIRETLRIGGGTWSDHWNQFLGKIFSYPMPVKETFYPIISRAEKSRAIKILLILGLMDDSSKVVIVTKMELSL